jgi:predicted nucleotidyltransferase
MHRGLLPVPLHPAARAVKSAVRKDSGAASDVDALLEFDPNKGPEREFFKMQDELAKMLGRNVDLNTSGFLGRCVRDKVLVEAETNSERA